MEKIQITAFCIQEFIISGLYVFHTRKILKTTAIFQKAKSRQVMRHLIIVNVLIIVMDLTLLGTEFAGHYEIETTYKSTLYSIKLKLEFEILNQLVMLTRSELDSSYMNNCYYSHSRSRPEGEVHFQTFSQEGNEASKTYFVSAGMGSPSKLTDEHREDYVMKTMDVEVTVAELGRRKEYPPLRSGPVNSGGAVDKGRRTLPTRSPAESEVEFANAGV